MRLHQSQRLLTHQLSMYCAKFRSQRVLLSHYARYNVLSFIPFTLYLFCRQVKALLLVPNWPTMPKKFRLESYVLPQNFNLIHSSIKNANPQIPNWKSIQPFLHSFCSLEYSVFTACAGFRTTLLYNVLPAFISLSAVRRHPPYPDIYLLCWSCCSPTPPSHACQT